MTIEELQKSIGFLNADRLLSTLQKTSQPTIQISNTDREPFLDLGEVATLDKPARNTNPLPLPPHVGHTIHIDIAYGSWVGLDGIKYALFAVDRASHYRYIYPMKTLHNIVNQINNL